MSYSPIDTACTKCSGFAQPGTVATLKYVLNRFSFARSLGVYNCRPIAGSASLSDHSCGRAMDVGIPTTSSGGAMTSLGNQVVRFFALYSSQLGIVEQIYDRVMYDADSPRGRYYGGVNPHRDHDHVGQTVLAAKTLTYAQIVSICGPVNGDDGMAAMQVEDLQITLNELGAKDDSGAALKVDGDYGAKTRQAHKRAFKMGAGGGGLTQAQADLRYAPIATKTGLAAHVKDVKSTTPHS